MTEWLLDAAISMAFFAWGYYLGKRYYKPKNTEKDASVCSCTHPYSMHTANGTCNVVTVKYKDFETRKTHCPCVRYDGIAPAHIYMKDN